MQNSEFNDIVNKLITDNPRLIPGTGNTNAAKNIRIELKEKWPSIKFSVKCKSFSGGNSIDVSWTDGPTTKQVDQVIQKYSGGYFDGMTDYYNYTSTHWTDTFGSSKYIMAHRRYSDAMIARAISIGVERWGAFEVPTVEDFKSGNAWNMTPIENHNGRQFNDSWTTLINQELANMTRFQDDYEKVS